MPTYLVRSPDLATLFPLSHLQIFPRCTPPKAAPDVQPSRPVTGLRSRHGIRGPKTDFLCETDAPFEPQLESPLCGPSVTAGNGTYYAIAVTREIRDEDYCGKVPGGFNFSWVLSKSGPRKRTAGRLILEVGTSRSTYRDAWLG